MQQQCKQCKEQFQITDDDLEFLEKVSPVFNGKKELIPPPTYCPDCRQQRRLSQCNETHMYPGVCGLCNKQVVTENPPHANQPIYCHDCWYSNKWDPRDYGKDFDFNRPLFEQFTELERTVPAINLNQSGEVINSEYIHYAGWSKNCYLIGHADYCEDCCYGYGYKKNTSCMDGYYNLHCELCYDSVYIHKSYRLIGCQDCVNCSSCAFLKDCIGCKNCFLCTGLRDAEYYFENRKCTKEEYEGKMKNINLGSHSQYKEYAEKLRKMSSEMIAREFTGHNLENSTGNYMQNCKNCKSCFDVEDGEDLKHCYQVVLGAKDSRDIYQYGSKITECYECAIVGDDSYHIVFCNQIFVGNIDLMYCSFLANSCKNCFGCVNMVKQEYCILNKQYTSEEYEELVPKIIAHMRETGEWGEFFPINISRFGYNKTTAQLYYPLTKEEVEKNGWDWDDYDAPLPATEKTIPADQLPDSVDQVPDDILNWAIVCEETDRPFRLQPLELRLLREMRVPIPRRHPEQRHIDRFLKRNPRKLWDRHCAKCEKGIRTTYSPERSEKVYCESCYQAEVY